MYRISRNSFRTFMYCDFGQYCAIWSQRSQYTQLPGRLFSSPSDISKKLSHHFLLHFPIGMGSYDHHTKYQGVFMDLK